MAKCYLAPTRKARVGLALARKASEASEGWQRRIAEGDVGTLP